MTLHASAQNRRTPLPTIQAGADLTVLLADYLGNEEKGRGYAGLMRRAADHRLYDRVSRWRTAPNPETTAVAVVRKLLPMVDRTRMANILGMSLENLEVQLTAALPKAVREHARTVSCHLPRWHRL